MFKTKVCGECTNILSNFKKVCRGCSFLKCYEDRRGNIYFVRPLTFEKGFKTFFVRPGKKKQYDCEMLSCHLSFAEAQSDLNKFARERRLHVYGGISPSEWSTVI